MYSTPRELCKQEPKEFIGHKDEVNCISYSPDFQFMVTGSDDKRVRIFNVKTKVCIIALKGHESAIKSVAVSQCSKYIASGSFDKTARIWRTCNGSCIHILQGHKKSVEHVAFSPGAIYLCTGSWDRTAILWCTQTGYRLRLLQGHEGLVQSVAFSHDLKFLASGSWDFTVRVWTLNHRVYRKTLEHLKHQHQDNNVETDHSENGEKSCSDVADRDIPADNHEDVYKILFGHSGNIHSVTFSKIGMLASGSWDRTIRLWNPKNGVCLRVLIGHIGWVQAVSFSPDSTYVASAADDDFVKVWDIPTGECINTLEGSTDLAHFCSFTPEGYLIASGSTASKGKELPKRKDDETESVEDQLTALLNQE
ncbi:WD repeat-containing protein 38-like [Physella acuta]|uniref:WD repeat-containing protein 38-like n=1 Tax=Physella acuta TaxID=109671 RepID=UPI0027DEA1C6|nr:WD repeat-containing protein 38-like [Physella acuta]